MNNSNYIEPLLRFQENASNEKSGLIHKLALMSVFGLIFLLPWGDGIYDGLPKIFGVLSFGFALLYFTMEGTHRNYSFFHLFIVLFWAWLILSVLWTPDLEAGVELAPRAFQLMLLPFVFSLIIINKNNRLLAYQAYVLGNYVASGIIIRNYLIDNYSFYGRFTIANIDTDLMSVILALSIPMAAYLAKAHEKRWLKIINIFAIPLVLYAIFLTGTRTGSIVALIGIAYWLFTHRKASIKVKIAMLVLFIVSIVGVLNIAPKASVDRIFSSGKSITSGSLNYRTVIWKASLNEWKKSPVIGTGLGGLGYALSKEHVNFDWAHNTYIHLLTENGIIGLTLYLFIILSVLYFILQTPLPEKVFLLSLLLVIMVSQLSLHSQIQKETWFVLTMLFIHANATLKRT